MFTTDSILSGMARSWRRCQRANMIYYSIPKLPVSRKACQTDSLPLFVQHHACLFLPSSWSSAAVNSILQPTVGLNKFRVRTNKPRFRTSRPHTAVPCIHFPWTLSTPSLNLFRPTVSLQPTSCSCNFSLFIVTTASRFQWHWLSFWLQWQYWHFSHH